ncbi:MAG: hypothetical protein HY247_07375 [archaeon]|nr:MAG: hypothetical protein HY247_07375 [archaeon]
MPRPKKVLIVAGVARVGKSTTIGKNAHSGLKASLRPVSGRYLFSHEGKGVCIFHGSCQEQRDCPFCDFEAVNRCMDRKMRFAEKGGCSLLITAFRIQRNRKGELNKLCITEPIKKLRGEGVSVKLTYLPSESAKGSEEIGRFMSSLGAEVIPRIGVREQVQRLWNIFLSFDP